MSSPHDLRKLISEFYWDLYQVNFPKLDLISFDWEMLQLPVLSSSDKEFLMIPFSHFDIRSAMFNICDSKSPGPDGFSAAFFKQHCNTVGDGVVSAVRYFFAHGFMLKVCNRTFIILLPKVEHPDLVSQFHPIGLCNVIYKCIAKCITHRLRSILPSLISDSQNAFVPGRLMSYECLIAHEIMCFINAAKARRKFYAAVKLDMNKAYDRVRWDFLFAALEAFGFPPTGFTLFDNVLPHFLIRFWLMGSPLPRFVLVAVFGKGICYRRICFSYVWRFC